VFTLAARHRTTTARATSDLELRRLGFGTRGDFFLLGYVSYAIDLALVNTDLQVGNVD
jgi:hypothetical protein